MRLLPLLAFVICIISRLPVFAASIPHVARDEFQAGGALDSPTTTISGNQAPSSAATSAVNQVTARVNSTTTSNTTAPVSTTVVSLNTATVSENGTVTPAPGALPLEPQVTPAFGVGGFILIATGAILALIGIRNSWVQVFLSAAFLTSLGVTVLIVYVMNPPVRVAVQGAYLVAIFFTGVTFGALSIVFKELTEGLGCLLGGFCVSMWLLCLRPGGLLTDTNAKAGLIGAISVAFYALPFSRYTRPYGLIVSAGVSGGTAVALGIDCYSRAGLKEFWLYIWALNEDVFPLGTGTYPITRNIRVELAVTVIVAILGVVSQLRLWKVIREKRSKEEAAKKEEEKRKEEAEAEVAHRLEENNMREREAWEAQYANVEAKLIPELGDGTQCAADKEDLEKGDAAEVNSISGSSQVSYRCSDCRKQEASEDSFSDATRATGNTDVERHGEETEKTTDGEHPMPFNVFDGATAARLMDDKESDVTAMAGSDTATVRSKRFSGMTLWKRTSVQSSLRPVPSQEALVHTDDESSMSAQGAVDDSSDRSSDCHDVEKESREAVKARSELEIAVPKAVTSAGRHHSDVGIGRARAVDGEEECLVIQESALVQDTDSHGVEEGLGNVEGRHTSTDSKLQEPLITESQDAGQNESHPSDDTGGSLQGLEPRPDGKKTDHEQSTTQADEVCPPMPSPADAEDAEVSERIQRQSLEISKDLQTNATHEIGDFNCRNSTEENTKTIHSEEENLQVSGEHTSLKTTPGPENHQSQAGDEFERQRASNSKQKGQRKTEKPKLDAKTVKHLPEQTSRVVQTYRTNEWAKHLCDAEIPEPEPIEPITKESVESPVEAEEVPAPVNVEELLQTPLTVLRPPAADMRANTGKEQQSANDIHRMSNDYRRHTTSATNLQSVREPQSVDRSSGVPSTIVLSSATALPSPVFSGAGHNAFPGASSPPIPTEQHQAAPELTKPRWKGPPPLLAVREDMMRSRVSSTCLSLDPWASRNSPRQSIALDTSVQISPTPSFPESSDDVPLSRRRAMLHQQMIHSPHTSMPPSAPKWSQSSVSRPGNPQAVMAAWRESIRENLKDKHNPLAKQYVPIGGTSVGPHGLSPFGPPGRNSSSLQVNLDRAIAEGMQRGDMSDLHREAMRRMQAKANQNMNGRSSIQAAPLSLSSSGSVLVSKTASSTAWEHSHILSSPETEKNSNTRLHRHHTQRSLEFDRRASSYLSPFTEYTARNSTKKPTLRQKQLQRRSHSFLTTTILRPPAVRLANPVNYVPRITPVTVPHPLQISDECLPLGAHRDAHPLLTIPERRRSRLSQSPTSLVVERSQGEAESGRSSIAVPRGQVRSGTFDRNSALQEMSEQLEHSNNGSHEGKELRSPERAHLAQDTGPLQGDRPRHIPSQISLRSQSQIASIPSNPGAPPTGGDAEVAEELAWGPAHPCYPHVNPHVPIGSQEYLTTRIIRIRRDWMVKGDLAPTFSNLYPEILDPLLPEQEFRRVIAAVNEELINAFDPFSFRNLVDGALGLVTGWLWEDIGAPGIKSHLQRVEAWLDKWNREIGAKEGVHIWSLRRTAYLSLDIQIPDPKVGIVQSEGVSLPGTRPSSGVGLGF
ncbi:hypothetical protein CNMCM6106_008310 [Aspergillus hiratsukae]|uniref:Ras modification protein ERF4 n=1 Tax=Aspergillus hiratsukae TaxID=1194566 RepID=A0A8H6PTT9_9EURO|nr:hypothetical protein CNMCM6106_008310 [Aspergillus hiratsukae]